MKIVQIKSGQWKLDFTLNKKRVRRVIIGTKKMAEQAMTLEKERIYRHKYGIPETKNKIKFKDYTEIYIENFSKYKRSYKNEGHVINRLNSWFGDKFLTEITPGDIDKFKQKRKLDKNKKGEFLDNSTINRDLIILQSIFTKAIDSEDYGFEKNPVKKVKKFEEDSRRERILTHEEMVRLIKAAEDNPWGGHLPLFLKIALNTGMRRSEILSLKWENVDFKNKCLIIPKEFSKSKKARKVPMNDVVKTALRETEKNSIYVFLNPKTGLHMKLPRF